MLRKIVKLLPFLTLLSHPSVGKMELIEHRMYATIDGQPIACTSYMTPSSGMARCLYTYGTSGAPNSNWTFANRGMVTERTSRGNSWTSAPGKLSIKMMAIPGNSTTVPVSPLIADYELPFSWTNFALSGSPQGQACSSATGCSWNTSIEIHLVLPRYNDMTVTDRQGYNVSATRLETGYVDIGLNPRYLAFDYQAYYDPVKLPLTVDITPRMIKLGVVPSSETSVRDVDLSVKVGDVPDTVSRRVNVRVEHTGDGTVRVYDGHDELINDELHILNTKKLQLRINHGAELGPKEHNVRFTVSVL